MSKSIGAVSSARSSKWTCLFGLLLLFLAFAAYWPALHGGFIWDDDSWTSKILILLRNFAGLCRIWSDPTAMQQYYPLSGTTFWLDYHFWKFWTFPYHVENVVLHLIAVLLFWRLLQKLELPGAWLAAGIFALHPVMVESVAWVTERKNVLSMVFFLGALLAYGRFNSFWKTGNVSPRKWVAYTSAFFLLLAALLAKTTTFSFPAVVLLIGWWKNGRIRWRGDVLPSLPFFAIAIGMFRLDCLAGKESRRRDRIGFCDAFTGALSGRGPGVLVLPRQTILAGKSLFHLSALETGCQLILAMAPADCCAGRAGGSVAVAEKNRTRAGRRRVLLRRHHFPGSWIHERVWGALFVCVGSLGLSVQPGRYCIIRGIGRASGRTGQENRVLFGFAAVLLPLLALLTWKQSAMYADIETLWRITVARDPEAFLAYNNLGYLRLEKGRVNEAISYFNKSLEINPNFSEPENNLGDALVRIGKTDEGMRHFRRAAELDPDSPASYYNLGNAWLENGHPEEAMEQFRKALRIYPGFAKAQNNLGSAFLRLGQTNEAFYCFQKAVKDDPHLPEAHNNFGNLLLMRGQITDAIGQYRDAFEDRLDFPEAFNNLTRLLIAQGKPGEAIVYYQQALRFNETADLHNDLGNLLVRQNRLDEAINHYESAVKLKPENGEFHYNLAVVLALRNRLDAAVAQFQRALELMPQSAQTHYRLALALQSQKHFGAAIAHFEKAIELNPKYALAQNNLAWLLATAPEASLRDGRRAVELARQASQLSGGNHPEVLDTLAAAYAEAGQFDEAVKTAKRAMNLAATQNNQPLTKVIQARLELYEKNLCFREPN